VNSFGSIIKKSREEASIPLRKVAAFLDIGQVVVSKIGRGQRKPKRELVEKLAEFFNTNKEKLLIAWLSDKVLYEVLVMAWHLRRYRQQKTRCFIEQQKNRKKPNHQ
jgi:transcriptional regulator with XRE-family HTH domain